MQRLFYYCLYFNISKYSYIAGEEKSCRILNGNFKVKQVFLMEIHIFDTKTIEIVF